MYFITHHKFQCIPYCKGLSARLGWLWFFFTLMTNPIKLFLKYLEISAQCIGSLLVRWPCCSGELCGSWVLCFYLKKTTTRGSIEENQRCRFNLARKMYLYETAKNCSVTSLFYKIIICTLFSL